MSAGVYCVNHNYSFTNWSASLSATTPFTTVSSSSTSRSIGGATGKTEAVISGKAASYPRKTSEYTVTVTFKLTNRYTSGSAPGTSTVSKSFTVPALESYSVHYEPNAGEDTVTRLPDTQTKWYDSSVTLSTTKPDRQNYIFKGWAVTASGAVAYSPGEVYSSNASLTLYAVWELNMFTIKFNANGGNFDTPPEEFSVLAGDTFYFSTVTAYPTKANFYFVGWSTNPKASSVTYVSTSEYQPLANDVWFAVWKSRYIKSNIDVTSVRTAYNTVTETYIEDSAGMSAKISWTLSKGKWLEDLDSNTWIDIDSVYMVEIYSSEDPNTILFSQMLSENAIEILRFPSDPLQPAVFFNAKKQYLIKVIVSDFHPTDLNQLGTYTVNSYISVAEFTMDFNRDGTAICFFGEAPDEKIGLFLKDDELEAELSSVFEDIGV